MKAMKFQKGDLVKYEEDILLITDFRPFKSPFTNDYNIYTYINLTTDVESLKHSSYSEPYLDSMAKKIE